MRFVINSPIQPPFSVCLSYMLCAFIVRFVCSLSVLRAPIVRFSCIHRSFSVCPSSVRRLYTVHSASILHQRLRSHETKRELFHDLYCISIVASIMSHHDESNYAVTYRYIVGALISTHPVLAHPIIRPYHHGLFWCGISKDQMITKCSWKCDPPLYPYKQNKQEYTKTDSALCLHTCFPVLVSVVKHTASCINQHENKISTSVFPPQRVHSSNRKSSLWTAMERVAYGQQWKE